MVFSPLRRVALMLVASLAAGGTAWSATLPVPAIQPVRETAAERVTSAGFGDYLSGLFAMSQADYPIAAAQLLAAHLAAPHLQMLTEHAFVANLRAGLPAALPLARQLPASNPVAQLTLATEAARLGKWRQTQMILRGMVVPAGSDLLQPLLVAWALVGEGQTDAALAVLRPDIARSPFAAIYALHAALVADLGGRALVADRYYRQTASLVNVPSLRMAQIFASWQARHGAPQKAAEILHQQLDPQPAAALVLPAMLRDVARPPIRTAQQGMAEAYLAVASELHVEGQDETAQLLLHFALLLRPDFTAALLLRSDIDTADGRIVAARAALAQVPANDPLSALARLRRASLATAAGDTKDAEAMLRRLVAEFPTLPEPRAELGSVLVGAGRFDAAVASFTAAIARSQAIPDLLWRLHFDRGMAYYRAGDWKAAEPDLKIALKGAPNSPAVLNFVGYAWAERGENLSQARELLERAARLQPQEPAIIDSLGWVKLRQGDLKGAVATLLQAVQMAPADPEINGHYGTALWEAGRQREAVWQWQQALLMDPSPRVVADLRAQLRRAGYSQAPAATTPAVTPTPATTPAPAAPGQP